MTEPQEQFLNNIVVKISAGIPEIFVQEIVDGTLGRISAGSLNIVRSHQNVSEAIAEGILSVIPIEI